MRKNRGFYTHLKRDVICLAEREPLILEVRPVRKTVKAACRGCHGGCMYLLTVEDGTLVKAVPDPDGPLNRGRGLSLIHI